MNRRLLFVGVSSMSQHAGQHKLYFIADLLGRSGVPVTVLLPDLPENRAFFEGRAWVEAIFYRMRSAWADCRLKSRVLRQDRWAAVWVVGVGLRSLLLRGPGARGIPLIKDFDEFPSMIDSFGPVRRGYLQLVEWIMIRQADGFTCASALLEDTVRRRRPELGDRLCRLTVAISRGEHVVQSDLVARFRAASAGRSVFLYVGSINRFYEDQIDEVLQLAVALRGRNADAQVKVLGGGPDFDYFRAKGAALMLGESLVFAGHAPRGELASHMEAADVLVFPFPASAFNLSRCPTKAFHYAAANRPVVTNRTGEVAVLFGDRAWYYPERDVTAFADCCLQALEQRRNYNNAIPFESLTWDARARQLADWLAARAWLPRASNPAVPALAVEPR